MDTKDIPNKGPSDWRREPSEQRNAVIGKLGEEASELASRCCRCMIQGVGERDPGDGRSNLEHLQDEMADVYALPMLAEWFLKTDPTVIHGRKIKKYEYKFPWLGALPR